jgi:hypothetical protein
MKAFKGHKNFIFKLFTETDSIVLNMNLNRCLGEN